MDTEKVILISGLGLVIVVGAFIFFGPSPRPRRRRGQICGLVNLGNTCFINSLLQALASCPVIVEWLSQYVSQKNSFVEALHTALLVVNGQHPNITEDPYTAENVIKCLFHKGWTISPEEHDVHELLNVIMTTIEEEIHHSGTMKVSSFADLLDFEAEEQEESHQNASSLITSEGCGDFELTSDSDKENFGTVSNCLQTSAEGGRECLTESTDTESLDLAVENKSEANHIVQHENDCSSTAGSTALKLKDCDDKCILNNKVNHAQSDMPLDGNNEQLHYHPHCVNKRTPSDWKNKDLQSRQSLSTSGIVRCIQSGLKNGHLPGVKGSVWVVPPCEGLLAGKTVCTRCKYKSPVKYDKFGCISLTLPSNKNLFRSKITLYQLLDKFMSPELINGVSCESCEKVFGDSRSSASSVFKTCSLGKLPPCLIFHIQRTTWQMNGMTKRHDYIEFPEMLSMHTYVYNQAQKENNDATNFMEGEVSSRKAPVVIDRFKYLFRLSAVIVHKGNAEHGHFVTYRRSTVHQNSWYCISDTEVIETSLTEVLQTSAYMLFYSKCQVK